MKDALSFQVQQLLKQNHITIDFKELTFQIKSHPTYPSLHAITGVLDHFNIENLALDVPVNSNTLNQLPITFLAQLEVDSQKQFAVVTKLKHGLRLVFDSKEKKTRSQSEFLEQFTGIVLAVDKDESHVITNHSNTTSNLTKGFIFGSLILIVALLLKSNSELANYLYFSIAALGIYFTVTILKQEQGEPTILGNAFCSNPTEKKNCNAVLSSKGATLLKEVKLSDLSFIYFTSLTLVTLILMVANVSIFIPQLISIIVLPITLYSIYYQFTVIKKWCFLCLCIVGTMWVQTGISIAYFSPNYELTSILITTLSFTIISTFWLVVSKIYKDNKTLKATKLKYFKFKRNFELFYNQLSKSKIISTHIDNTKEIVFGNTNSTFNITIVSNPMCGHCKAVHDLANQILKRYSQFIKLTIRFNVNPKDPEYASLKITTRLLELYHIESHETCLKAMDEIYGDFSTEEWLKQWSLCSEPKTYLEILQNEYDWCIDNAINFTPEILINGQSYPKAYDRKDLIYFLEDLLEQYEANRHHIPLIKTEKI
nr:vitamin K epoxide reductase family protein [uncultured Psychroserpens sp.]